MVLHRTIENDTVKFYSEEKEIFWMKEVLSGVSVAISIGGNLVSETTHEFLDEMLALISVGKDIIIDFSEVKYITASYMKALLTVQVKIDKMKKGSLCLKNIPEKIYYEFKKIGMHELLWIE